MSVPSSSVEAYAREEVKRGKEEVRRFFSTDLCAVTASFTTPPTLNASR